MRRKALLTDLCRRTILQNLNEENVFQVLVNTCSINQKICVAAREFIFKNRKNLETKLQEISNDDDKEMFNKIMKILIEMNLKK